MSTVLWVHLTENQAPPAVREQGGVDLYAPLFQVQSRVALYLDELVRDRAQNTVKLARAVHEAAVKVTELLRQKIAEVEQPFVVCVVRSPLEVFACDDVGGPRTDIDADDKPVVYDSGPPTVGYAAFALLSLTGTATRPEVRIGSKRLPVSEGEPSWMTIPDLDADRVANLDLGVRAARDRALLTDYILGGQR